MKPFALLLLFGCFTSFSQDTIITFRGKHVPAKILVISGDSIRYKRSDYPESIDYLIHKKMVSEIKYQNGTIENFFTDAEKAVSLDDLKKHIVEMINGYGYEEDSDKQKYLATFEGDYLRLAIMKGEKVKSKGFLFDFSRVHQFHPVSKRSRDEAYINIYVIFLDNPKTMKWAKQKLIMKVKGHIVADDIQRSLQNLNRLLLIQKKVAAN